MNYIHHCNWDKRGSSRGGARGGNQRGRSNYRPPAHNPPAPDFHSGFRNEQPSPPPPYNPPYNPPPYNNPSNNPPPYNPPPYIPPPPQPTYPPQPPFPQVYPSPQPVVNNPASSFITVSVSQIPPAQYPAQQPPQSYHQMPPTQYPTQQPPQSHHQMAPPSGYYPPERPPQPPAGYYQPDPRGPTHPNPDFNRPGPQDPRPSYGRHSDNQTYRAYPDNRDQSSRNDRDSYSNSRSSDHQQSQPHFRSHSGQSQNEPHYKKPDYRHNQPHNARPNDPQDRSRPFNKGPQNRSSNFENERNPDKQFGDRRFPADKNVTQPGPPPSYHQQAPDKRKEGVYRGSDKKPDFSTDNKVPGEGRKRSRERNYQTNKPRLHSTDSTNSDRSEPHRHYQGPVKHLDRNVPVSERESDVLSGVQGNIDQGFKGRMKGKAPFERRVSNASSVDSEQSTASELLENVKDAGGQRAKRSRYKGKKGMQNKDKFQSMPDLNSQETGDHFTEEGKATSRAKERNCKKSWNQKKNRPVRNPKKNDNEANKENPEMASIPRITKASITIGIPFNDVASFKGIVIQNIDLESNASLVFVNDSIICSEKQGSGTFLVTASSKQLGKRLVKGLCANLRKNLKANVEYNICGVEENKQVTGDNSAAKEKQNHMGLLKADDFSRRSMRKKVTEILERSSFGDKKKTATGQKTDEVKVDVLPGNAAKSNKNGGDTRSTPTKVSVTINKIFSKKEDVFDLVLSIVEDKTSWIRLVPNSVNIAKSMTICEIEVLDKENTKKIIEKLHAFDFEGVRLRCFVAAVGLPLYKDDSDRTENLQEQIKKNIEDINKKTQQVLELHEKKIADFENALEIMNSSGYKEENSDDFDEDNTYEQAALFDKLAEVTKQRETFCSRRDQLIDSVSKLESLTTTDKSLSDLLQSVGVECERLKAALPIYARREDIVRQISENQVSVILGETGSGKSTQMAQYIYEAGLAGQGLIVCTQPRKVAAVTLAERVAKEMANSLGNLVGYKTGMRKNITKDKTKIVFATDHCLLNECLADPNLSQYTCIIVDEAHERSIYTDLLLGMIKACLTRRPDLKVVITSATIDPEIFIRYFRSGPELRVSGRTFPVEVVYSKLDDSPEFENFEMKAVTKAVDIHKNEDPGDILVFLTSPVEIMRCCEEFQKIMTGRSDFKCFPLHGQLPPDEQKQVFKQLPNGVRKIVFATNCAETSITIDGIKYVIDTGVAKEMRYDGKKNICTLGTFVISKSSADQRKGRAGRTASGKCYRLFSEEGYKNMEVSSQPEILRVPLGQSVLKLAELGVDVKKYDFVQAPSAEAIESALSSLRDLGALSPEGITDVGRWISKLPVSPKEGFLVYHGNQKGLLYDSVVLASLIANGSNLFYRGLTETDAQISARSKSEFGSVCGDIFTWLEVYKVWNTIPQKEQSKWCQKNGINNKAINFTKQFVNDVVSVLDNELGVKLEKSFSSDESAPVTLRKILFEANVASVCHYLGHIRAGYYAVVAERQVHVHPSSTLLSNNSQPEWIVYTEFTKTSRDFIKGITAVEEEWVFEAAKEGRLNVSIDWVKQHKSVLVHRETVGPSVFRKLVGPRYSQLRVWEDELANAGMKAVVVEADNELGTIDIFSTSPIVQETIDSFITTKQEVVKTLKLEEAEISILKKQGTEPCGVRVLLGEGGCVKSLLLPDQSNTILVKKAAASTTEKEIRAKFGVFGDIKECVRFKRADPWGFVRYSSFAEAQAAVDRTCKDEENCAVLKLDKQFKGMVNRFEARLSWCRRPIKGTGTAFIKCPPIEKASLVGKCIRLPLGVCEIQVSKRGDELVCFKTGQAQEMDIKKAIMDLLDYDESLNQNIHVTVLREKVEPYSQRDINRIKDDLANSFSQYVAKDKFNIVLRQGKGNPVNQVAFIHFENPTNGFQACRLLNRKLEVAGQSVEISPCLKTTLHVPEAIMKVCKDRFEEIFKGLEKFKETSVHIRQLKQGDFAFDIKSEDVKSMVEARELLQRELEGETIDCTTNNLLRKFLKQQGREALKKIECLLDVLIVVNERRETVHIYGSEAKVNQTQIEINKYLGKLAKGKQVDVNLKGSDKPPGLMKELIRKYGSLHDELVQQFSLTDVDIDFRQQKLSIFGPIECVDNIVGSIAELAESLSRPGVSHIEKEMPDCVVCMTPVEQKSELYRLEACGHSYCLDCLKMQIKVSVQDKKFPIVCSGEDCGMSLVWKDLNFCIRKKWTSEEKLMDKAVNAFVASNPEKYKFCLTPECPVIYAVTTNEEGCEFNCPSCFMSLCTSCHTAYHSGLTCHMSSIEEEVERQLKLWVREDPTNRKWCPKCKIGVEKTEGCNKMQCSSCRTVFCWICLEIAVDSQKCYAHLMKNHGDIY